MATLSATLPTLKDPMATLSDLTRAEGRADGLMLCHDEDDGYFLASLGGYDVQQIADAKRPRLFSTLAESVDYLVGAVSYRGLAVSASDHLGQLQELLSHQQMCASLLLLYRPDFVGGVDHPRFAALPVECGRYHPFPVKDCDLDVVHPTLASAIAAAAVYNNRSASTSWYRTGLRVAI